MVVVMLCSIKMKIPTTLLRGAGICWCCANVLFFVESDSSGQAHPERVVPETAVILDVIKVFPDTDIEVLCVVQVREIPCQKCDIRITRVPFEPFPIPGAVPFIPLVNSESSKRLRTSS
jgi:hypothetical protein